MSASNEDQPTSGSRPIRVFIVDDHELVRRGLRDLLEVTADVEVIGEAGSVAEAKRRIPAVRPDLALLDVRLPDGSGVELCRWMREQVPTMQALMVTTYDDADSRLAALAAGASGFVLKQIRGPELVDAVHRIAAGMSADQTTPRPAPRARTDPRLELLTEQERRVLDLIVEGLTNREIGDRLGISEKTVRNHVTHLLDKLGLNRRTQAAVYLLRHAEPGTP
jgi:two-component system response regulator DevR